MSVSVGPILNHGSASSQAWLESLSQLAKNAMTPPLRTPAKKPYTR